MKNIRKENREDERRGEEIKRKTDVRRREVKVAEGREGRGGPSITSLPDKLHGNEPGKYKRPKVMSSCVPT